MLEIIIYLISSYILMVSIAILIVKRRYIRNTIVLTAVIFALFAAPLVPYGVVELQTRIYRNSLLQPTREAMSHMNLPGFQQSNIRNFKVLRKYPHSAIVYVVFTFDDSEYDGSIAWFTQSGKEWKYTGKWDVVWSDAGSAHGNVFPPYFSEGDY